jgi:hypothetical protein
MRLLYTISAKSIQPFGLVGWGRVRVVGPGSGGEIGVLMNRNGNTTPPTRVRPLCPWWPLGQEEARMSPRRARKEKRFGIADFGFRIGEKEPQRTRRARRREKPRRARRTGRNCRFRFSIPHPPEPASAGLLDEWIHPEIRHRISDPEHEGYRSQRFLSNSNLAPRSSAPNCRKIISSS